MKLTSLLPFLISVVPVILQSNVALAFPELEQISEPDDNPVYIQVEGFEAAINANSIQWDQQYLKVITVATEYEALVIYDCQQYRSVELAIGDGMGEMQPVQQPEWNTRDVGFVEAACDTAQRN